MYTSRLLNNYSIVRDRQTDGRTETETDRGRDGHRQRRTETEKERDTVCICMWLVRAVLITVKHMYNTFQPWKWVATEHSTRPCAWWYACRLPIPPECVTRHHSLREVMLSLHMCAATLLTNVRISIHNALLANKEALYLCVSITAFTTHH